MIFCYLLAAFILYILPFSDCNEAGEGTESIYTINQQEWVVLFILLWVTSLFRSHFLDKHLHRLYAENRITYQSRKKMKLGCMFTIELLIAAWQVYGNFIFYERRGHTSSS